MTSPKLARLELWGQANAFNEGRAYRSPVSGKQFPSTTTILRGMPKNLEGYSARMQLEWDLDNWEKLSRISHSDGVKKYQYAYRWHADWRGHVGDRLHNALESLQTGNFETMPDNLGEEEELMLEQWELLNQEYDIEPLRNEITVGDEDLGWMGTFDSYCLVNGIPTLVDFKSSAAVQESAFVQISALMNSKVWYIETGEMEWTPIEPEPVEQGMVFHIRHDFYQVVPVTDVDLHYQKYEHLAKIWYINEEVKNREKTRDTPKLKDLRRGKPLG